MDKYSVLSISIIGLILIFTLFNVGENEEVVTGFADDIKNNDSGFIFFINDGDGCKIKSFSFVRPDETLHEFIGTFSDDGNIFFVSKIR